MVSGTFNGIILDRNTMLKEIYPNTSMGSSSIRILDWWKGWLIPSNNKYQWEYYPYGRVKKHFLVFPQLEYFYLVRNNKPYQGPPQWEYYVQINFNEHFLKIPLMRILFLRNVFSTLPRDPYKKTNMIKKGSSYPSIIHDRFEH